MEKSANLGFSPAFAALGDYAFRIENNNTKAAKYFTSCWDLNKDVDCAFNLGIMWSLGKYPNEPKNMVNKPYAFFSLNLINYLFKAKALEYWSHAAKYGQIDAQIRIADFNARGYNLALINPELAAMYLLK